jgi:hypothetical protein
MIMNNAQTCDILKTEHGGSKVMRHSKELLALIDGIIHREARYIPYEGYYLDYNKLSDSDIEEITAQLMADDEDLANEATGCDNPAYLSKMLPALIRHLKSSCDKDEQIEFMKEWRHGVADYSRKSIESLLEDRLEWHAYFMNEGGAL